MSVMTRAILVREVRTMSGTIDLGTHSEIIEVTIDFPDLAPPTMPRGVVQHFGDWRIPTELHINPFQSANAAKSQAPPDRPEERPKQSE